MATRRERVVLDLQDDFTTKMARAAAATALLARELDGLDGSGRKGSRATDDIGRSAEKSGASIDKLSGRLSILKDVAGALGPSLIPIGAVGVPAVAGLAAQFGFAALGAGVAVGAFQGVGDALKAMNKAHLEPSIKNLQAAQDAMNRISPSARDLVLKLRSVGGELGHLRDAAAAGMFPGVIEGIDSLEKALPKVERIVAAVAGELGDIASSTGASLASARWADFFDFLATDAPSALADMATAAGNTTHALAELWMALDPMNDDFSSFLVKATADLDKWASGLSKTDGFKEFMEYIDTNGPKVGETLAAVSSAVLQITEAAAPIGGPILEGITAFAKAVSAVADSDLGTPIFGMVAALSALNLVLRTTGTLSRATFGGPAISMIKSQTSGYATAIRNVKTATAELGKAQEVQAAAGQRAAGLYSSGALVSTATKRGSVSDYVTASRAQAAAAEKVTAAEQAKSKAFREGALNVGKGAAVVAGLAVATTGLGDKMNLTNTASLAMMGMMAGPYGAAIGAAAGATIDLAHANDGLVNSTTALHAAMKTGDIDAMTAAYDRQSKKLKELSENNGNAFTGVLGDKVKDWSAYATGSAQKAKKEQQNAAGSINGAAAAGAAEAFIKLGGATDIASKGFSLTALSAAKAAAALGASRKAANGVAHQFVGLGDSVNDAKVSLGGWLHQLEAQASALSNFASNAQKAAKRGLRDGLIKELEAAGPAGAMRMKQLADASDSNISRANKAWAAGQRAIRAYTDAVGGVKDAHPSVQEKGSAESAARVRKLQAQIDKLKGKTVATSQRGADDARTKIAQLQAAIDRLHGKTVTVTTAHVTTGNAGSGTGKRVSARGNIFHYAQGDVANRHEPELAGPGDTRVWREPETQGEAYIPLANDDRRPRARSIAEETVGLLGGNVEWFANGGSKGGSSSSNGSGTLRHRFNELSAAVHDSTKAIAREKNYRDALISKRDSVKSSVSDKFQTDLFGSTDVWSAGGTGSTIGILKADIAKAKAFQHQLKGLSHKGLNGDALAAIASTGDIAQAQALNSSGKSGVSLYEKLYNQREKAANAAGAYAGQAAYGHQIAAVTKTMHAQEKHLKSMEHHLATLRKELSHHPKQTGHEVGKNINHAAAAGHRRKAS